MSRPNFPFWALVLTLSACQTVGPRSVQYGRGQYNEVLQQTNGEQLLLNLVRLRYRDVPLFLEVTSIASSLSLELGLDAGGTIGAGTATIGNRVNYIERPTITYAPLHGERFGRQLLAPIKLQDLLLLYNSGWAIDRIFKLYLQRLARLPNAPRASGPTPEDEPLYRDFFRVCEILRGLWSQGRLDLSYVEYGEVPCLAIHIEPTAAGSDEVAELARLLGMAEPSATILLSDAARPGDPVVIPVVRRSTLGSMYYASQGVDVPDADAKAGRVTITRDRDGQPFDWTNITGSVLKVHHSNRRPSNAYLSVRYRGRWWYIDDSDLDSKSTFAFLSQSLELQSGDFKQPVPVMTLPIGAQ